MGKITNVEVLEQEYQRFIEPLKINPAKLKELEISSDPKESSDKENLLTLIEEGLLVINDENRAVFKIFEPVVYGGEGQEISELIFRKDKPKVQDLEKNQIGKTDIEKTRRTFAFLIDGKYPSAFFSRMESDDFTNFSRVARFFLPQ